MSSMNKVDHSLYNIDAMMNNLESDCISTANIATNKNMGEMDDKYAALVKGIIDTFLKDGKKTLKKESDKSSEEVEKFTTIHHINAHRTVNIEATDNGVTFERTYHKVCVCKHVNFTQKMVFTYDYATQKGANSYTKVDNSQ